MAKYIIEIPDGVPVSDELVPFDMCRPSWYSEAYEKGKAEAEDEVWGFVRIITDMTEAQRIECFGNTTCDLDDYLTYQEAKAKYEAWMQEHEIKVGDEVKGKNFAWPYKGVVVDVDDDYLDLLELDAVGLHVGSYKKDFFKRTGRHFSEVEELLKKMRGEE